MSESLKAWWRDRSEREQRLILVMAALAAIVLAWLLVVRPLDAALADARARHEQAVIALAKAKARVAAAEASQAAPRPALAGPVDALIARSAADAGFPVTRVEREGDAQATLIVEAARPQAFFGWVATIERDAGLEVARMRVTANSDRTVAAQVTFRARGR